MFFIRHVVYSLWINTHIHILDRTYVWTSKSYSVSNLSKWIKESSCCSSAVLPHSKGFQQSDVGNWTCSSRWGSLGIVPLLDLHYYLPLGFRQIRLVVPEGLGPSHSGRLAFSHRVTSLIEMHFNQQEMHNPHWRFLILLICFSRRAERYSISRQNFSFFQFSNRWHFLSMVPSDTCKQKEKEKENR